MSPFKDTHQLPCVHEPALCRAYLWRHCTELQWLAELPIRSRTVLWMMSSLFWTVCRSSHEEAYVHNFHRRTFLPLLSRDRGFSLCFSLDLGKELKKTMCQMKGKCIWNKFCVQDWLIFCVPELQIRGWNMTCNSMPCSRKIGGKRGHKLFPMRGHDRVNVYLHEIFF